MTADEYKDSIVGQLNQLLNLLYGLLLMSVVISLFGIVNTLVLSVYERTREIGLLRAIGASRRQIRRSVRYESVITSVIGGILGVVVGVVFAYVVTTRFGGMGITVRRAVGAAGGVPRRLGGRRRAGGDPAGATGGAHRHPRSDPLRVREGARAGRRPARAPEYSSTPGATSVLRRSAASPGDTSSASLFASPARARVGWARRRPPARFSVREGGRGERNGRPPICGGRFVRGAEPWG